MDDHVINITFIKYGPSRNNCFLFNFTHINVLKKKDIGPPIGNLFTCFVEREFTEKRILLSILLIVF